MARPAGRRAAARAITGEVGEAGWQVVAARRLLIRRQWDLHDAACVVGERNQRQPVVLIIGNVVWCRIRWKRRWPSTSNRCTKPSTPWLDAVLHRHSNHDKDEQAENPTSRCNDDRHRACVQMDQVAVCCYEVNWTMDDKN